MGLKGVKKVKSKLATIPVKKNHEAASTIIANLAIWEVGLRWVPKNIYNIVISKIVIDCYAYQVRKFLEWRHR